MGKRRKCFRLTHFSQRSKGKHMPRSSSYEGKTAAVAPHARCVRLVSPLPKALVPFPIDLEIEKTLDFSPDLKNRKSWKSRKSTMRICLTRICKCLVDFQEFFLRPKKKRPFSGFTKSEAELDIVAKITHEKIKKNENKYFNVTKIFQLQDVFSLENEDSDYMTTLTTLIDKKDNVFVM